MDPEADTTTKASRCGKAAKKYQSCPVSSVKVADPQQRHQYCPEDSWCQWKKDGENKEKDYHLDPIFLELLEPAFIRLSEGKLMERCLPGFSQNQNEGFNSLIWKRAPKQTWQGPKRVKIAAYLAALHFCNFV